MRYFHGYLEINGKKLIQDFCKRETDCYIELTTELLSVENVVKRYRLQSTFLLFYSLNIPLLQLHIFNENKSSIYCKQNT